MKVALTGSSGYVGGFIRELLRAAGHEVLELCRSDRGNVADSCKKPFVLGERIEPQWLAGCDALVHCAYDFSPFAWPEIHKTNVLGTELLFSSAKTAGIEKVLLVSSISAFDGCVSLYGRAKLAMEQLAHQFGGMSIRPGLVFGGVSGGMMKKLESAVRRLPVVPVIGGRQELYVVHGPQLAEIVLRMLNEDAWRFSKPVTACCREPLEFRKILRRLAAREQLRRVFVPVPWRLAWSCLFAAEWFGISPGLRSDSLLSLMNPNPAPDFEPLVELGVVCRSL